MPLQKLVALAVLFGFGAVGLSAAVLRVIKVNQESIGCHSMFIDFIIVLYATHLQVDCRLPEQPVQGEKHWIQIIE